MSERHLFFLQAEHADSIKELTAAAKRNARMHSQMAESQKQQWKLTASQQEAEAAREVAEAGQEAAEAGLAEANHSIALLLEQLAAQHTQMDKLKACTSIVICFVGRKTGVALVRAEVRLRSEQCLNPQLSNLGVYLYKVLA